MSEKDQKEVMFNPATDPSYEGPVQQLEGTPISLRVGKRKSVIGAFVVDGQVYFGTAVGTPKVPEQN